MDLYRRRSLPYSPPSDLHAAPERGALSHYPAADQSHILNGRDIFQRAKTLPKRSFIF
jgi:hypothetical protein